MFLEVPKFDANITNFEGKRAPKNSTPIYTNFDAKISNFEGKRAPTI